MSLHAVNILGINVTTNPKKEILEELWKRLEFPVKMGQKTPQISSKFFSIATPNPEQLVLAQHNSHFRDVLNQADVSLPDGIGIVWASRILSLFRPNKTDMVVGKSIQGVTFMEDLVLGAAKRGLPVALIGGYGGVAVKAFECLQKSCYRGAGLSPNLVGWAEEAPEFSVGDKNKDLTCLPARFDSARRARQGFKNPKSISVDKYFETLAQRIIDTKVQLVFVGLGAPKQELFIDRLIHVMSFRPTSRNPEKKQEIPGQARDDRERIVFMSVGGSFDEVAGLVARPPAWVSNMGFKWLWRLVTEPWRFRRQLALVTFVFLVIKERFTLK